MKREFYSMLLFLPLIGLMAIFANAADPDLKTSKENLKQQRANYQQTVSREGANSPAARQARNNLRSARHNYYNQRRSTEGWRHARH